MIWGSLVMPLHGLTLWLRMVIKGDYVIPCFLSTFEISKIMLDKVQIVLWIIASLFLQINVVKHRADTLYMPKWSWLKFKWLIRSLTSRSRVCLQEVLTASSLMAVEGRPRLGLHRIFFLSDLNRAHRLCGIWRKMIPINWRAPTEESLTKSRTW